MLSRHVCRPVCSCMCKMRLDMPVDICVVFMDACMCRSRPPKRKAQPRMYACAEALRHPAMWPCSHAATDDRTNGRTDRTDRTGQTGPPHRLIVVRHGMVRHGTARHGTARHGTARHGMARHGTARHGTAWHGTAWHGTAQQCHMP